MNELTVSLLQANLQWENPNANFSLFEEMIGRLAKTDLIILPEMFSTGFSMQPAKLFDKPEGKTLTWLQKMAKQTKAAITGSAIIRQENHFYNRLFFVFPEGEHLTYDKKHLFTYAGEEKVYAPGNRHLIVSYKGWKIMPLVCYDLRFPVWCRNTEEVDLQIFVANWPERRSEAWQTLLKARAIENMCYVAGLNRVGEDGNGIAHSGDSVVHDELGKKVLQLTPSIEESATVKLSKDQIEKSRSRFSFLKDRDQFSLD